MNLQRMESVGGMGGGGVVPAGVLGWGDFDIMAAMEKLSIMPSQMSQAQFIVTFAEVFEKGVWVAVRTFDAGLDDQCDSPDGLLAAMVRVVESAGDLLQLGLIHGHPELGARVSMGAFSEKEQDEALGDVRARADEKLRELCMLNMEYRRKFRMPFIMAVKGANADTILATVRERLKEEDAEVERRRTMDEIYKIASYRLHDMW